MRRKWPSVWYMVPLFSAAWSGEDCNVSRGGTPSRTGSPSRFRYLRSNKMGRPGKAIARQMAQLEYADQADVLDMKAALAGRQMDHVFRLAAHATTRTGIVDAHNDLVAG